MLESGVYRKIKPAEVVEPVKVTVDQALGAILTADW